MWIHLTELHLCFVEQSINTVFEEPQKCFFGLHWPYADKGNFISSKSERSIIRNFYLISEFISQPYNLYLRKQFTNTPFVETAKWYLGAHRGPWWKRKYPHIKLERSFLRDCFLICDFITQNSTLPFLQQFANTVVVDSAKWYLGAHWALRCKRKYPQTETGKNPSEKLHWDVWT